MPTRIDLGNVIGPEGPKGEDGAGVIAAEVNDDGALVMYTNKEETPYFITEDGYLAIKIENEESLKELGRVVGSMIYTGPADSEGAIRSEMTSKGITPLVNDLYLSKSGNLYQYTRSSLGKSGIVDDIITIWERITSFSGIPGPKGDTGPRGAMGATGATGPAGPKGDNGTNGKNGGSCYYIYDYIWDTQPSGKTDILVKTICGWESISDRGKVTKGDFLINKQGYLFEIYDTQDVWSAEQSIAITYLATLDIAKDDSGDSPKEPFAIIMPPELRYIVGDIVVNDPSAISINLREMQETYSLDFTRDLESGDIFQMVLSSIEDGTPFLYTVRANSNGLDQELEILSVIDLFGPILGRTSIANTPATIPEFNHEEQ